MPSVSERRRWILNGWMGVIVRPSHNTFIAVMRGQGPAAQAALLRVDGAGKIDLVAMDTVKFTSVTIPNPAQARNNAITDLAFANGRVWVAGLSNEEFASKLWSVAYPFTTADRGTSVEIYHGNHGAIETRSPVMTFLPFGAGAQAQVIAAYTCTPLVRFQMGALKAGEKVVGRTMMDLGAGNQPIDMVRYSKGGQDFLLMANSRHGIVKVPTAQFATLPAITAKVDTAGSFEKIASMPGVVQLDLLDAQRSVSIAQAEPNGPRDLNVTALP